MKFLSCITLSFLMSFSHVVFSASNSGEWMTTGKSISEIIIEGANRAAVVVLADGGVPSNFLPDGCNSSPYNVVALDSGSGKEIYSLLLAAHLAGKSVRLVLSGCTGSRPVISHVRF